MIISRSSWEKLVELWDVSEIANTISKALASLYIIKTDPHRSEINIEILIRNIEKCRDILRKLLADLDLYIDNKAPETGLVTLLINAYGDVNVEKIRDHLAEALQGLEKIVQAIIHGSLNTHIFEDKNIIELENLLRRLSDTLSRKVEQIANEIYAF